MLQCSGRKERVWERHPGNQSNPCSRPSSPDKLRLAALPVMTGATGYTSVCYSVNNVNNFPVSSHLAHFVGFVSNHKQEAAVWFCSALERKCALKKPHATQGSGQVWVMTCGKSTETIYICFSFPNKLPCALSLTAYQILTFKATFKKQSIS